MSCAQTSAPMAPATRGASPAARLGADTADESADSLLHRVAAGAKRRVEWLADQWEFQYSTYDAATSEYIDRDTTVAHNIVGAAVTLGLSVIMLILMAIVAGYFVQEAPSNGAFSSAIDQVESVGGTAFILLAVALLAVPVVAIVGYFMRSGLGGFISGGGMSR